MKKFIYLTLFTCLLFIFSVSSSYALVNYSYDANGNLISDGSSCYIYNQANHLFQVKNCSNNQLVAEYFYDFEGNRISKKEYVNGVLAQTIYSPDRGYETKKLASGITQNTSYYYANNELVARKNPDNSKTFYQSDHLGSTSLLTNSTGGVVEETSYTPYGEVRTGGTQSKYQYTGQEKDLNTGLNYYGARYYNSHTAHFTQPDSMLPELYDPQQLNRYAYTRNNPIKYTDPSGNSPLIPLMIGGAVFGGAVEMGTQIGVFAIITNQSIGQALVDPNLQSNIDTGKIFNAELIGAWSALAATDAALSGISLIGNKSMNATAGQADDYSAIGSTGKYGQVRQSEAIRQRGLPYENQFDTRKWGSFVDKGSRVFDSLVKKGGQWINREAKTGRQSLTKSNLIQNEKDEILLNMGILDKVYRDFYRSPVTGLIGGTKQYMNDVMERGFEVRYWN
jgi:RHS repeat-associated protein